MPQENTNEPLSKSAVIGSTAMLIHYDLSLKAMELMIEKDDMKVENFRELPEVKRIWSAMDVIQEYYL
jgi:hypothetical protein